MKSTIPVVAMLLAIGARSVTAQDTVDVARSTRVQEYRHDTTDVAYSPFADRWLIGGSVGIPGSGRQVAPELLTVGMSMTRLHPGSLGVDLSFGTMPYFVASGLGAVGARANVILPLPLGDQIMLLPDAGVSGIGAIAPGGGGGIIGANAGIAAIIAAGSVGFRAATTFHYFSDATRPIWLLEFGIVGLTEPRFK